MTRRRSDAPTCLNCGSPIGDSRYCGACGQEHLHEKLSMRELAGHVVSEVFTLDSKAIRSVVPLMTKPGFLTNEYRRGRRVHFIRPLRLYLVASLWFFVLLSLTNDEAGLLSIGTGSDQRSLTIEELAAVSDSLSAQRARARTDSTSAEPLPAEDDAWLPLESGDVRDWPIVGGWLASRVDRANRLGSATYIGLLRSSFARTLPKAFFLSVPLFAAVLHLLYLRRRRFFVEHFVFVLHVQAAWFFALGLSCLVPFEPLRLIVVLLGVAYLYRAVRVVYEQNRWRSGVKSFLFLQTAWLVMLSVVLMAAVFSALTV